LAEPIDARLYHRDVRLADGGVIHIRAIRPDDKQRLQGLFRSLSDQSIYYRFFSRKRQLSPEDLDYLTGIDMVRHVALAATVPTVPRTGSSGSSDREEEIIGVGRYAVQGHGRAEVAYAVADAHQHRGIGSILLQHLATIAHGAGLDTFVANVLPENVALQLAFLTRNGFCPTITLTHGVAQLSFPLGARENDVE